jgi:hypothetical protein
MRKYTQLLDRNLAQAALDRQSSLYVPCMVSSQAVQHVSAALYDLQFTPCKANSDVCYHPAIKDNGFKYYKYILVYVDDLLVLSHLPQLIMATLRKAYHLKEEPSPPKTYLGATINNWSIPNECQQVWAMSSTLDIKEAIRSLELELGKSGHTLSGKLTSPMCTGYRPELDVSAVLEPEQANYYATLIGILCWAVELGYIDIYINVALFSSHIAQPRLGHLEQVLHIFSYLKHHDHSSIVFDPNYASWENSHFSNYGWTEFYKDAKEATLPNVPNPRGNPVQKMLL